MRGLWLVLAFLTILLSGCLEEDALADADTVVEGRLDPQGADEDVREYRFTPPASARQVELVGNVSFEGSCTWQVGSVRVPQDTRDLPEYTPTSWGDSPAPGDCLGGISGFELEGSRQFFFRISSDAPAEYRYGVSFLE